MPFEMKLNSDIRKKYNHLKGLFTEMNRVLVAYSGGIDSTLLLKVGTDQLGDDCIGAIAVSASLSVNEHKDALEVGRNIGAHLFELETNELSNTLYQQNNDKRCFYCKTELYQKLQVVAEEKNIKYILDGTNLDDTSDFRPGRQAATNLGVRSPLIESGFSKEDIRILARFLNLSNWDKPAQPCLSSRVAYGVSVNEDILNKIDQAESFLKARGFKVVRVRYFGEKTSIEVGSNELDRLHNDTIKQQIFSKFNKIGLHNVNIDWDGYSSGKLNVINTQAL
jgi:pyridinium-3,5-biscarboxylic acid mononucleotide sulfurtransferase